MADLLFHDPVEDSARGSHDDLLRTQDTVLNYYDVKQIIHMSMLIN